MKNGGSLIGLFQGIFDSNILTFNPGCDVNANTLKQYDNISTIQTALKSKGAERR